MMRPRAVVRRLWRSNPQITPRLRCHQTRAQRLLSQTQSTSLSTRCRPTVSFLSSSAATTNPAPARTYASERTKAWLRHEGKLLVRFALISWGGAVCLWVIYYFYLEEMLEREYPTPHEWAWRERKMLRDAHKWTNPQHRSISWAKTYQLARNLCLGLEDVQRRGGEIPRLNDHEDPNDEVPWEFIPHDISGMSEEWRRGYFECIMLTAKAAEHVDGWLKEIDNKSNGVWAPDFVIGPSNPRPRPIPPGSPPAPREEDCEVAFPPADRYYLKILATKGLTPRQKMEAALEYASFIEFKQRPGESEALYNLALAEATQGMDQSKLPYNPKTLVLKDAAEPPSQNILDAITAIANHRARNGDSASALPIYLSLLRTRRSLSDMAPRVPPPPKPRLPLHRKVINFFAEPDYPPPPPDGNQAPWRSPEERCQEASLNLYIGEILYMSSSREDGIAWTREGVDMSEEQLRELAPSADTAAAKTAQSRCRECLKTGLDNWSVMVARLAKEEKLRRESRTGVLSFWSTGDKEAAGRWDAEDQVVKERVKRTADLVEEVAALDGGVMRYFKA